MRRGAHRAERLAVVAPRRGDPHLLPHRVEDRAIDLVHELDHAFVAGDGGAPG
jgi:hypothetical protein